MSDKGNEVSDETGLDDKNEEGWDFEDDDFEVACETFDEGSGSVRHSESKSDDIGSVWGWGMGSLLSTASGSVSSFTSQVTSGLSTVLNSSLAVSEVLPIPKMSLNSDKENSDATFGLDQIIGGVSQLGSKVLSGGLDTLETIGKKTMEVLQEGDPGFKKKRAFFENQETLSHILREAKDKAEISEKEKNDDSIRKVHFETLFDDFHGLVHLEALEMVSKQCEIKLNTLLTESDQESVKDLEETLEQVRELCELPPDDEEKLSHEDFKEKLKEGIETLTIPVPTDKLIETSESFCSIKSKWLGADPSIIHREAIKSLALFSALGMELIHRVSEILLVREHRSTACESESLLTLTLALCGRISAVADEYTSLIISKQPEICALITNIYLESSNSSSYLQNAFNLIIPVIQLGAANS